ncbi:MAG: ABC transporter ATP-binding protein [Cyanobacteria bacterium P01_G01_bin.54]
MERSAPQRQPIIQLRQISKAFGSHMILDEVDLEIYPGEALVIIGPSGTGKSTILRIIAGLLAPDSGEIYVQGQRRQGLIEDQADPITISMVFQQAALFDSLSVMENVGFRLFEHSQLPLHEIERLVEERLEMVGLPGVGSQYPAALSGGMRKRVSFARAVMADPTNPQNNPKVILYDEPTAGLDPIASTVIEDLVRDLQRAEGICGTYVMVSHQQSTIRRTADRIIFLYDGRVQWQGTVPEIDTTENPLVRQFFSASTTGPIRVVH